MEEKGDLVGENRLEWLGKASSFIETHRFNNSKNGLFECGPVEWASWLQLGRAEQQGGACLGHAFGPHIRPKILTFFFKQNVAVLSCGLLVGRVWTWPGVHSAVSNSAMAKTHRITC